MHDFLHHAVWLASFCFRHALLLQPCWQCHEGAVMLAWEAQAWLPLSCQHLFGPWVRILWLLRVSEPPVLTAFTCTRSRCVSTSPGHVQDSSPAQEASFRALAALLLHPGALERREASRQLSTIMAHRPQLAQVTSPGGPYLLIPAQNTGDLSEAEWSRGLCSVSVLLCFVNSHTCTGRSG